VLDEVGDRPALEGVDHGDRARRLRRPALLLTGPLLLARPLLLLLLWRVGLGARGVLPGSAVPRRRRVLAGRRVLPGSAVPRRGRGRRRRHGPATGRLLLGTRPDDGGAVLLDRIVGRGRRGPRVDGLPAVAAEGLLLVGRATVSAEHGVRVP